MRISKRNYQHTLLAQEDRVIANAPVVMDGGRFEGMHGTAKVVSATTLNVALAVMVMSRGVVALYPDFNSSTVDIDELWDQLVPKDEAHTGAAATDRIDTDVHEGTEETVTFSEPGLPSVTTLAEGNGIFVERVHDKSFILTFADTSDGFIAGTPNTFIPNFVENYDISRKVTMGSAIPGFAMLAMGTPILESTQTTPPVVIEGREWLILKHLHQLLEDAWKHFAGLDEAGAESPFTDIAALIVQMTEPLVVEETTGAWAQASFNVWSDVMVETFVPFDSVVPQHLTAG